MTNEVSKLSQEDFLKWMLEKPKKPSFKEALSLYQDAKLNLDAAKVRLDDAKRRVYEALEGKPVQTLTIIVTIVQIPLRGHSTDGVEEISERTLLWKLFGALRRLW